LITKNTFIAPPNDLFNELIGIAEYTKIDYADLLLLNIGCSFLANCKLL
jgi:hypothetical protein